VFVWTGSAVGYEEVPWTAFHALPTVKSGHREWVETGITIWLLQRPLCEMLRIGDERAGKVYTDTAHGMGISVSAVPIYYALN
jgi:hypothetical protein